MSKICKTAKILSLKNLIYSNNVVHSAVGKNWVQLVMLICQCSINEESISARKCATLPFSPEAVFPEILLLQTGYQ